nr:MULTISPECIES: hypothetical protein [unclassified Pseudoalteromonas]
MPSPNLGALPNSQTPGQLGFTLGVTSTEITLVLRNVLRNM